MGRFEVGDSVIVNSAKVKSLRGRHGVVAHLEKQHDDPALRGLLDTYIVQLANGERLPFLATELSLANQKEKKAE